MKSSEDPTKVSLRIAVPLSSKSRPFPVTYRVGVSDIKCSTTLPEFQTQLFSSPSEDLLESHIAAVGRDAAAHLGRWNQNLRYAVAIKLGSTAAGGNADIDNVAKLVLDSLTGVLWQADRQVDDLSIKRTPASRETLVTVSVIS